MCLKSIYLVQTFQHLYIQSQISSLCVLEDDEQHFENKVKTIFFIKLLKYILQILLFILFIFLSIMFLTVSYDKGWSL